eukprot:08422.XXX_409817_409927_1 [CDS] Oithona nana genome sequencing.
MLGLSIPRLALKSSFGMANAASTSPTGMFTAFGTRP